MACTIPRPARRMGTSRTTSDTRWAGAPSGHRRVDGDPSRAEVTQRLVGEQPGDLRHELAKGVSPGSPVAQLRHTVGQHRVVDDGDAHPSATVTRSARTRRSSNVVRSARVCTSARGIERQDQLVVGLLDAQVLAQHRDLELDRLLHAMPVALEVVPPQRGEQPAGLRRLGLDEEPDDVGPARNRGSRCAAAGGTARTAGRSAAWSARGGAGRRATPGSSRWANWCS